ncbi:MAG: Abi family protein [Hyphomicrobiaceae bacterium]|nr:Abi family protein [Hyphomicrobiaceae bacterium]
MNQHPLTEHVDFLSRQRVMRYLTATGGDARAASSLYDWNLSYSAFMFSNIALWEVALRNHISRHFAHRYGIDWGTNIELMSQVLDKRDTKKMRATLALLEDKQPRLARIDTNHVICELTAGFWVSQIGRFYMSRHAWLSNAGRVFALSPQYEFHQFVRDCDQIRNIRNRVAHHEPIFVTKVETAFGLLSRAMTALRVGPWHIDRHVAAARQLAADHARIFQP